MFVIGAIGGARLTCVRARTHERTNVFAGQWSRWPRVAIVGIAACKLPRSRHCVGNRAIQISANIRRIKYSTLIDRQSLPPLLSRVFYQSCGPLTTMHTALNYLATPKTLSYPSQDKNPNKEEPTSGSEVASVEIFLGHPVGVQHGEKQHARPFN